jgi:ribosomal protein S18 acetylase RimI-like enzyme
MRKPGPVTTSTLAAVHREERMKSGRFTVRRACAADVGSIIRMKTRLAVTENATFALRWTHADWLREGFGVSARFCIYVAECDDANVGMVIYSERAYTGWREPALYIQDLFVELEYRRHGIGRALLSRVAADAVGLRSPMIELTMHSDNPAREFYRRAGFELIEQCVHYLAAGAGLATLVGDAEGELRSPPSDLHTQL